MVLPRVTIDPSWKKAWDRKLEGAKRLDPDAYPKLEALYLEELSSLSESEVDQVLKPMVVADCNRCQRNYDYDSYCWKCRPLISMTEFVPSPPEPKEVEKDG
jgi:hypothetical protein